MIKALQTLVLWLLPALLFAQILPDSSVQVIGYWDNGEQQTYTVSNEKYRLRGNDTASHELITYEVQITIKDSTEKNYLIEWLYQNFTVDSDNPMVNKIMSLTEDIPVLLRTDEYGAILEVVNWEEVRDRTSKATEMLLQELKGLPNADAILGQVGQLYQSKESVEANAIKDAQQFYTFHGAAYVLNEEVGGKIQLPNVLGKKPFDADLWVMLTEIDEEDDSYVIRMSQSIDPKQLTDVTYDYLKKIANGAKDFPKRKDYPEMSNETTSASRIHGSTGWVLYSIETKTVSTEGMTNVEERIIQLK